MKAVAGRNRRVGGCARRLVGLGMTGLLGVGGISLVGALALGWGYRHYVVDEPGAHLDREHIRTIIAQETPVYFRDGQTRIGVFFEAEHRQFVPYEDLPPAYVMAIVAAEDGGFWRHPGLNVWGIARAMRDNLLAGDVVAGGSTLTQQTAKNLYYRPDRTLRSKGVELLNALRLEAHYDKTEILEFYVNQFHVTGNGRGLGIAARHFFDKDPEDLTLLECAFLAGLVKGPAAYDPFQGDDARRARAVERAHDRTRYVLRRMLEQPVEDLAGPLPGDGDAELAAYEARLMEAGRVRAEAQKLLDEGFELPFRRGTFRYESSAVLDEIARRLSEPPFDRILGEQGIESAETSGLVVVTTLDGDAQREATWSLWHHLTEVGTWMERLEPADFVLEGQRAPRFDPDFPPRRHEFRVARVKAKTGDPGKRTLELDLGGPVCVVDRDGVVRVAVASKRGRTGDSSAKASSAEVDAWVDALPLDATVLASVREVPATGPARCDLEVRPTLQGSVMVLQDGQIRAMVGGNDNRNFNRATALRQFGSTWKPLVFHAALGLGWKPDDVLDNTRGVFPFSTTFYYPRPDHEPAPRVSMSWAGVNSENLASIWLLYHLTDKLDGEQVRSLAVSLDLARRPDESADAYRTRIQKLGVLPTRDRVEEGLYLQSRQEVLTGLASSRHPEDAVALQSVLYGWGFAGERTRVQREGPSARAWKQRALDADFRALSDRVSGCRFQYGALADALDERRTPEPDLVRDLTVLLEGDRIRVACGAVPDGYVKADPDWVGGLPWPEEPELAPEAPTGPAPAPAPRRRFPWQRERPEPGPAGLDGPTPMPEAAGPKLDPIEDLLLDDRLHLSTLEAVQGSFERRRMAWDLQTDKPDLYDPEVLYWHQDFRVLLALRHLSALAEEYGVQTEIREVLAMPLGASEITLEEATSVYAGLCTGLAWQFPGTSEGARVDAVPTSTLLIQEIRDPDGRVLYRAEPEPVPIASPEVAEMTADILRNVVLHGTGRRASSAVQHEGQPLPVGGKTGTTNDFKNAAFVGYAPVSAPGGYEIDGGWFVGAYVGYDDNRPMVSGRIKLAGSSGALPAWIGTVDGLSRAGLLGEPVAADGPPMLVAARDLGRVPVDARTGLPTTEPTEASVLVPARSTSAPDVDFRPLERPPRIAPGTDQALGADHVPAPAPLGLDEIPLVPLDEDLEPFE